MQVALINYIKGHKNSKFPITKTKLRNLDIDTDGITVIPDNLIIFT